MDLLGDPDGGTTNANWDASVPLGWQPVGPLSAALPELTAVKTYDYRGYASNAFGDAWAPDTRSFTTRLDLVAVGGTNGIGENMDFEDALTPRPGYPYVVWDWDGHNCVSVGKDGVLMPMRGNLMMEAASTTRPWESNYAVYHDVSNRHHADAKVGCNGTPNPGNSFVSWSDAFPAAGRTTRPVIRTIHPPARTTQ